MFARKTKRGPFPEYPTALADTHFGFFLGKRLRTLDLATLCRDSRAIEAYGDLMVALHNLVADPIGRYLIEKIVATKTGPIRIAIVAKPRRLDHIRESTWFDAEADLLYWSRVPSAQNLIDLFSGRFGNRLLKHELTHVLEKRVLGDRYPEDR